MHMMINVIFVILVVLLLICVYLLIRNDKVLSFFKYIINISYQYNIRKIESGNFNYKDAYEWFAEKWKYNDFLFSLKPLKLKYWFTKEELDEIKK